MYLKITITWDKTSHTKCNPTLDRGRYVSPKRRDIFIILDRITHQKTVLFRVGNYSHKGGEKKIYYWRDRILSKWAEAAISTHRSPRQALFYKRSCERDLGHPWKHKPKNILPLNRSKWPKHCWRTKRIREWEGTRKYRRRTWRKGAAFRELEWKYNIKVYLKEDICGKDQINVTPEVQISQGDATLLMNDVYYPLIGSTCFGLSPVHHQEHHPINCMTH